MNKDFFGLIWNGYFRGRLLILNLYKILELLLDNVVIYCIWFNKYISNRLCDILKFCFIWCFCDNGLNNLIIFFKWGIFILGYKKVKNRRLMYFCKCVECGIIKIKFVKWGN